MRAFQNIAVLALSTTAFYASHTSAFSFTTNNASRKTFLFKQITTKTSITTTTTQRHGHPGGDPQGMTAVDAPTGFIDTELRGAAMRLHTKSQAPKEGQVEDKSPKEPHITTHMDYLHFLVDSQHVYQAFEDVVQMSELHPELEPFVNTKLERTQGLEQDIQFMCSEYNLERPSVGVMGQSYAEEIRKIGKKGKTAIPEFMCHYYNYYFAHTAGGRMIGKQMAALLLNKKTLEFYKWDGDVNEIKGKVRQSIEDLASTWNREQKDMCVDATMAAFRGGGAINSYLSGGRGGEGSHGHH